MLRGNERAANGSCTDSQRRLPKLTRQKSKHTSETEEAYHTAFRTPGETGVSPDVIVYRSFQNPDVESENRLHLDLFYLPILYTRIYTLIKFVL